MIAIKFIYIRLSTNYEGEWSLSIINYHSFPEYTVKNVPYQLNFVNVSRFWLDLIVYIVWNMIIWLVYIYLSLDFIIKYWIFIQS